MVLNISGVFSLNLYFYVVLTEKDINVDKLMI